jgi:oxysterol-binding protein-related protein 9/10/11
MTFNGSLHIKQTGHANLHIDAYDEDYLQTLPSVSIKSLLTGSPYPELEGPVYIYSSSGYTSKIEFTGTSMLGLGGDKRNTVRALLYKTGEEENPLYEVEGRWSDELVFKDVQNSKQIETYNTNTNPATPLTVAPLEQQDPWESRRAWSAVAKAIQAGDMQGTSEAKARIEKAQREMRQKEQAEWKKWEPKFFSRVENDPEFERLAAPRGVNLHADRTDGIWRFDKDKFRRATVPFHGDLTPSY